MDKEIFIVCESCGERAPDSEKLCPFCASILESSAWQSVGRKPARLQQMLSWLRLMPLAAVGLVVIYCAALLICLVILALIFGSLAFLATLLGRTGATFQHMIAHAQRSGISVVWTLVVLVIVLLLMLIGAHRFWQKRQAK